LLSLHPEHPASTAAFAAVSKAGDREGNVELHAYAETTVKRRGRHRAGPRARPSEIRHGRAGATIRTRIRATLSPRLHASPFPIP